MLDPPPKAELKPPLAVSFSPAITELKYPLAVLPKPPVIELPCCPLAVLLSPPVIVFDLPLAAGRFQDQFQE